MNKYKAYIKYHTPTFQFEEVLEVKAEDARSAACLAMGEIICADLDTKGHFIKFDECFVEVIK